jgi:hypothetical protein
MGTPIPSRQWTPPIASISLFFQKSFNLAARQLELARESTSHSTTSAPNYERRREYGGNDSARACSEFSRHDFSSSMSRRSAAWFAVIVPSAYLMLRSIEMIPPPVATTTPTMTSTAQAGTSGRRSRVCAGRGDGGRLLVEIVVDTNNEAGDAE